MTLPDERYYAMKSAEEFMLDLVDPKKTPRLSKAIRTRARAVLRHYPTSWDLKELEIAAPHIIQERMESLYKMVKEHDLKKEKVKDVDMTGKDCYTCKQGVYKETSLFDDWDGLLHCSNCGEPIDRWQYRGRK